MLFQRKDIIRAANNLVADFWKGGRSRDREKSRLLQPRLGNSLEMTFHLGIYCGASELIREHGEDAAVEATERADAMLKNDDPEAAAVWKRVTLAVEDIRRTELGPGEPDVKLSHHPAHAISPTIHP